MKLPNSFYVGMTYLVASTLLIGYALDFNNDKHRILTAIEKCKAKCRPYALSYTGEKEGICDLTKEIR